MATVIANARLTDGRLVDVHVRDGLIDRVHAAGTAPTPDGAPVTDVGGWLLLPAMAEPHAHVDKALTVERVPNPAGDLAGAIEAWVAAEAAGAFGHDEMVTRVRRALDQLLLSGVTAIRSHVNCGAVAGRTHLDAVIEAIRPYRDLIDVELVALPNFPSVGPGSEANQRALAEGIALGALVGGCPHLEDDGPGSIAYALDIAGAAGRSIDLHMDETLDPGVLTLPELARAVIERGFEPTVTASHCVSLGVQPESVQREVAALVADAGIGVVALPQTNLFLQGREQPVAMPRGLTAVAALRAAGVTVAAGADNVQDPFNLVGRSDPLETAALMVMAAHVLPDDAYDMVSNAARAVMGLAPVRMAAGDPADLVAIDAPSIRGAIADAPADRKVFKGGRIVAESSTTRTIHR